MISLRPSQLFTAVLLFLTTFTTAFPWPNFLPDIDSLMVRQNDNDGSSAASSATQTAIGSTAQQTSSGASAGSTASGSTSSQSGSITSSATNSGSKSGSSTTTKKTSTSYDARLPAGGVSLITPAVASGAQYYKIGDQVTFAWNLTSVSATPTALNIMASCSTNAVTYTIAMNQSVDVTSVIWDTGAYQETAAVPFPVASYTLVIYDADSAVTHVAGAGYLAAYDSYTFGMYTPQPYTPLNEFVCATCSGAMSSMEKMALKALFGTALLTVLSFTWFIGGLHVVW